MEDGTNHSISGLSRRAFAELSAPEARSLTRRLHEVFGSRARMILHYGSRAQGRSTRADSAYDFIIIVDAYLPAYRELARSSDLPAPPSIATLLAYLVPPNIVAVRPSGSCRRPEAKCVVVSMRHLRVACRRWPRDRFLQVRLSQTLKLAWASDDDTVDEIAALVRRSRAAVCEWARSVLPERFDLPELCQTILEISLASEIRPESRGHARVLYEAQRPEMHAIYTPLLVEMVEDGVLARDGYGYVQRRRPGAPFRIRSGLLGRISAFRTTLRLLKQPFLYDGWLDYIVHKIERSSDTRIELTERERRRPLIYLWPRVLRYLRHRPQREG